MTSIFIKLQKLAAAGLLVAMCSINLKAMETEETKTKEEEAMPAGWRARTMARAKRIREASPSPRTVAKAIGYALAAYYGASAASAAVFGETPLERGRMIERQLEPYTGISHIKKGRATAKTKLGEAGKAASEMGKAVARKTMETGQALYQNLPERPAFLKRP